MNQETHRHSVTSHPSNDGVTDSFPLNSKSKEDNSPFNDGVTDYCSVNGKSKEDKKEF